MKSKYGLNHYLSRVGHQHEKRKKKKKGLWQETTPYNQENSVLIVVRLLFLLFLFSCQLICLFCFGNMYQSRCFFSCCCYLLLLSLFLFCCQLSHLFCFFGDTYQSSYFRCLFLFSCPSFFFSCCQPCCHLFFFGNTYQSSCFSGSSTAISLAAAAVVVAAAAFS